MASAQARHLRPDTDEPAEQRGAIFSGGWGGKAVDQGEHSSVQHTTDTVRGMCVPRIGGCAPSNSTRAVRRHSSKVGAPCGQFARGDLCGGCRVTGIPTATHAGMRPERRLRGRDGSGALRAPALLQQSRRECVKSQGSGDRVPSYPGGDIFPDQLMGHFR